MNEFNFTIGSGITDRDRDIFFNSEAVIHLTDDVIMADLMFIAGIFPSKSRARQNGWDKPVPDGFSKFIVGKRKICIFVLKVLT